MPADARTSSETIIAALRGARAPLLPPVGAPPDPAASRALRRNRDRVAVAHRDWLADHKGHHPDQRELAGATGVTERTVRRWLRADPWLARYIGGRRPPSEMSG